MLKILKKLRTLVVFEVWVCQMTQFYYKSYSYV